MFIEMLLFERGILQNREFSEISMILNHTDKIYESKLAFLPMYLFMYLTF